MDTLLPTAAPSVPVGTDALLAAAGKLDCPYRTDVDAARASLASFSDLYKAWITHARGVPGAPEERRERSILLLHTMASAATLGDALNLALRFNPIKFGGGGLSAMQVEGAGVVLRLNQPHRRPTPGLISELWPLALMLVEMEWLTGATLDGVSGRVCATPALPDETIALLFDLPLTYGMPHLELCLPKRHLSRAIVAQPGDIDAFLKSLPLITLKGANKRRPDIPALVAGVVRASVLEARGARVALPDICNRLGQSSASLRRLLAQEGTGFREIRETVLDDLAKAWLVDETLSMDTIAERLGYSDAFAFRRAFRRRNAVSPSHFRQRVNGITADEPRAAPDPPTPD